MVTLITKDVTAFEKIVFYGNDVWIGFVQAGIVCYLIYTRIGSPAFAGIGFFLFVMPIQIYIGKKATQLRKETGNRTDQRLQLMQECLSAIKTIKMSTWEKLFVGKISSARKLEVSNIVKIFYTKTIILLTGALTTKLAFYILITTYVLMGNLIHAELVYYILSCFARLRHALSVLIPLGITEAAELRASVDRIGVLLKEKPCHKLKSHPIIVPKIKFSDVTVSLKGKDVLKKLTLKIEPGLTVLTGSFGSGKTSLLKTILGDYETNSGKLERGGVISYACQEPWVFPSTIRQNILFGEDYNPYRYQKVIEICGLKSDLDNMPKQDLSLVGDKGLNLSKGQKSRINLARAVYKNSDIYLLDDCLSSLDANVRLHVFQECVQKFLRDKLCVLVTNDINFVSRCDNIIVLSQGEIVSKSDLLSRSCKDADTLPGNVKDSENIGDEEFVADEASKLLKDGEKKNIYYESKRSGKVSKKTYKEYVRSGGGFIMLAVVVVFFVLTQSSKSYTEKMVSTWVNLEDNITDHIKKNLTDAQSYMELTQSHSNTLILFSLVILSTTVLSIATAVLLFTFTRRASNRLHDRMICSIMETSMDFFDNTYLGNILNRCSKDLATIDEYLPNVIYEFIEITLALTGIIILIASVNLIFLIPTTVFLIVMYCMRLIYLPTGRNLQRLDAATRNPVIGYLNASLDGLSTIKSHNAEKLLIEEFDSHQDLYTSANYMSKCTARAFGFFLDMLCMFYIASIIFKFLLYDTDTSVGDVGMAITQSFGLVGLVQYGIRQWADLENNMTSVERVLEYTSIKSENKTGVVPENWPGKGHILFKNVSISYKNNKPTLNNLNLEIKPGRKVGIVGKTGIGKTSLVSSLMRIHDFEGLIQIDGVDIKTIPLDILRKNISFIPQDPVVFSGTIRYNVDPVGERSDEEIWRVLKKVKLDVPSLDSEAGSGFSAGEKQLICLARSMMTANKIVILDEATANVDETTDFLVRSTLNEYFQDCTVLTVAHNLESVLDSDSVMVIDDGGIVEYDNPCVLFEDKRSIFRKMIETAGLNEKLIKSCSEM
ncbi:probable multidrug resistance-associated protein lethal(2)03659 isoform X2 [Aethina tumida]|nr:probable multidrug resistance-associated protein lethal(2)03659 isoform X2 [Aethina tumida]